MILPRGFRLQPRPRGPKQPPAAWAALGVRRADGRAWSAADAAAEAALILPAGAAGPAFLALPNHFVIRTYNNSTCLRPGASACWPTASAARRRW